MNDDDPIQEALSGLAGPDVDTDRALRSVHGRHRRHRLWRAAVPAAAVVLIGAVALVVTGGSNGSTDYLTLHSQVARAEVPPGDAQPASAALRAFSADMFKQVAADRPDANLSLSPASVQLVLAMALPGARGDTRAQILDALHLSGDVSADLDSLNALEAQLTRTRTGKPSPGDDPDHPGSTLPGTPPVRLNLANSVWVQHGYPVEDSYLDQLARTFGADAYGTDFSGEPDPSRRAINDWVAEHTDDKITDLLGPGSIDAHTRMVLANALTLKGKWVDPFDPPEPGPFTTASGSKVTASMLTRDDIFQGAAGSGWHSASVPLVGGAHLVVILPDDPGAWPGFAQSVDAKMLEQASGDTTAVTLTMPQFTTTTTASLKDTLEALGMTDAFDPQRANFSGIDGTRNLSVGRVEHKAHIEVNKDGLEAAAATAATFQIVGKAIGPEPVTLTLDRPYVYAVVDDATDAPLFIGQVTDPTAK